MTAPMPFRQRRNIQAWLYYMLTGGHIALTGGRLRTRQVRGLMRLPPASPHRPSHGAAVRRVLLDSLLPAQLRGQFHRTVRVNREGRRAIVKVLQVAALPE